jgi:hypothetical protein
MGTSGRLDSPAWPPGTTMRGRTFKVWVRRHARRLIAGACVPVFALSLVGLPLPAVSKHKAGVPFPCQDHVCGCQSADDCWAHCCCTTLDERLAWARERGVQPPPSARREMELASTHSKEWRRDDCCSSNASCAHCDRGGCSLGAGKTAASCCGGERPAVSTAAVRTNSGKVRLVLSWQLRRCQGTGTGNDWLSVTSVFPPPAPIVAWTDERMVDTVAFAAISRENPSFDLSDPPPRRG